MQNDDLLVGYPVSRVIETSKEGKLLPNEAERTEMYQDHANSSKNDLRQIEPLGVDIPVKMMNKEYLDLFDIQYNKLGDRICKATTRDWVALEDECVKRMTAYY